MEHAFGDILWQLMSAFHKPEEKAFNELVKQWQPFEAAKRTVLTRQGETERYLYLVTEGVQRAAFEHNGKESILVFSYKYSFSGVLDSFLLQEPSRFFLETITYSNFYRISYVAFMEVVNAYPSLERWLRIAISRVLAGTLERQVELISFSAEEKFTALLRRSPQVLQLIPQKYLAAYIGVDPATFSRMLSTVKL